MTPVSSSFWMRRQHGDREKADLLADIGSGTECSPPADGQNFTSIIIKHQLPAGWKFIPSCHASARLLFRLGAASSNERHKFCGD